MVPSHEFPPKSGRKALLLLLSLWLCAFCLVGKAQAENVIPRNEVEARAFAGSYFARIAPKEDAWEYEKILLLDELRKLFPNYNQATADEIAAILNTRPTELNKAQSYIERALQAKKQISSLLTQGEKYVPLAGKLNQTLEKWAPLLDRANDFISGRYKSRNEVLAGEALTTLIKLTKIARQESRPNSPSKLGLTLNLLAQGVFNVASSPFFSDSLPILANKDVQYATNFIFQLLLSRRQGDGSVVLNLGELVSNFQAQTSAITAPGGQMSQMLGDLVATDSLQQSITGWTLPAEAQTALNQKIDRYTAYLKVADQAVTLIGSLAGHFDPKLGKQITKVGRSIVKAAQTGLTVFSALSRVGTGAATAGYVGAAIAIASLAIDLFASSGGSNGPTFEEIVLQEIGALRQQVEELRQQMHERFDRLETRLNEMFRVMVSKLDQILENTSLTLDQVRQIQEDLVRVQASLYRMETNLYTFFTRAHRDELENTITEAINYRQNSFLQPGDSRIFGWMEKFHDWALTKSADPREVNNNLDYAPSGVYTQLKTRPLDENLYYLSQAPSLLLGLGANSALTNNLPFPGGVPPNPRMWAVSAEAYRRTLQENMDFASRSGDGLNWLNDITARGAALQALLKNITIRGTTPNTALFDALYTYYQGRVANLNTALGLVENDYYNLSANGLLHNGQRALDIFAGASQTIPWRPTVTAINYYDNTTLEANGTTLQEFYLPEPFIVAAFFGIGSPTLQINGQRLTPEQSGTAWIDARTGTQSVDPLLKNYVNPMNGQPQPGAYSWYRIAIYRRAVEIDIALRWQGTNIGVRTFTTPEDNSSARRQYGLTQPQVDHEVRIDTYAIENATNNYVRNNWTAGANFLALFHSASREVFPNDAERIQRNGLQLQVEAQADQRLREHQINLYGKFLAALDGVQDTHNVKLRAEELTGAKALWSAYITLGMSRSLDTNDQLRGLLFGNQSLPALQLNNYSLDTDVNAPVTQLPLFPNALASLYQNAITALQAGQRVPKADVVAVATDRANALKALQNSVLASIGAGQWTESLEAIEVPMLQLQLFYDTNTIPAPTPTNPNRRLLRRPTVTNQTDNVQFTYSPLRYDPQSPYDPQKPDTFFLPRFTQRITVKNKGTTPIAGPVSLVFDFLRTPQGVQMGNLAEESGRTLYFPWLVQGVEELDSPYVFVGVGDDNVLSPGEIVTVTVTLAGRWKTPLVPGNADSIRYTNRVLAGVGDR